MPGPLRILVADDNEEIRNGLCSALEARSGWVVCGRAIDGTDAVEKAAELKPDIVLVDVSMPGLNGFEAAKCIHEELPAAEILIVTEHDSRALVGRLGYREFLAGRRHGSTPGIRHPRSGLRTHPQNSRVRHPTLCLDSADVNAWAQ
jgi:CheY-like chemotaxis protein